MTNHINVNKAEEVLQDNAHKLPTRRQRLLPFELLTVSFVLALFCALTILLVTRDLIFAVIALGLVFILSILLISFFVMVSGTKPSSLTDQVAQEDQQEQQPDQHTERE